MHRMPTDADLATAREAVLNPGLVHYQPALMQAAWETLALNRGLRLNWDNLHPRHDDFSALTAPRAVRSIPIRSAAETTAPTPSLATTLASIAPRITAAVQRRLHPGGAA